MSNIIYVAVSLDGFIARKDGSIDWLMDIPNPEGSDFGFGEFIKDIDAIVMGRNTFEKVLSFGQWTYDKPVFVLSNVLYSVPSELKGKAELLHGAVSDIVLNLNGRGYHNLYIDGGKTIQQFLENGIIDEMIITTIPVILGEGLPLFGKVPNDLWFEYVKTEVFNNTLVKNYYKKKTR